MRIVVIGGSGLVGAKLVDALTAAGHEAVAASRSTGVDTISGHGLNAVLAGADVVVDASNSPTLDREESTAFFTASTRNILDAEVKHGVAHHVLLSIVGAIRVPTNGYYQGKVAQEKAVTEGAVPYTILRSTQFFEFVHDLIGWNTDAQGTVRLPSTQVQPVAADDVVTAITGIATSTGARRLVEIGGPDVFTLDELARTILRNGDSTAAVITDESVRPLAGADVEGRSLLPAAGADIGATNLATWLKNHHE